MKKTTFLLAGLMMISVHAFCQDADKKQALGEIIKDAYIPGIQLVYSHKGKMDNYNLGMDDEKGKQVTSNTIFEAASLSKSVFAYAVLRLYDRGIIDLDKSLLGYIGTYPRFNSADNRYARITARMVLRHTTGFPNWDRDSSLDLIFTPDSIFSYSGEGFLYLQKVVEKLVNKPLNQLMQEEVFTPLHMNNSSYVWTSMFDTTSAFGNSAEQVKNHSNANAAYSLLTCAHDYSLFLQAMLKGEGLKPATHAMMFTKQSAGNWYRHDPNAANAYINWGLGVGLQQTGKESAVWHWGDNGEFKAFYIAFPKTGESLVYFTHSGYGLVVTGDILNLFFGEKTWWPTKWLDYAYEEPAAVKTFRQQLAVRGFAHATEVAADLKKKDAAFKLTEHDLNELGFLLLKHDRQVDALEIFKLAVSMYPNRGNAYDSLAEGYDALGNAALAIENYKLSLKYNPKNEYATERIKALAP